jgi:hypothetical protein
MITSQVNYYLYVLGNIRDKRVFFNIFKLYYDNKL